MQNLCQAQKQNKLLESSENVQDNIADGQESHTETKLEGNSGDIIANTQLQLCGENTGKNVNKAFESLESDLHPGDSTSQGVIVQNPDYQTELHKVRFDKEKKDIERSVETKWKQWRNKYKEKVEKHKAETTWKNKITGVDRKNVPRPTSSKYSSRDKSKIKTEDKRVAVKSTVSTENTKCLQYGNGVNSRKDHSKAAHDKTVNRIDTDKITNTKLLQVLQKQKHKETDGYKQVNSVSKVRENFNNKQAISEQVNVEKDDKTKSCSKDLEQVRPDNMSEAEVMREIIDKYLRQNWEDGEFLHWTLDDLHLNQVISKHVCTLQCPVCAREHCT